MQNEAMNRIYKYRIALLEGDSIQALPFIEAYSKMNVEITIFYESKLSYGYFSRFKKNAVKSPKCIGDYSDYKNFIFSYLESHPQDLLIPMFNNTAEFASMYKQELEELGCKVEIPDWNIFIKAHNKEFLMDICKKIGVLHPRTGNPQKMGYDQCIEYVKYPCMIKPNLGAGAKGIKMIRNKDEYEKFYEYTVRNYGASTLQEYIPQTGKQLKVQIYRSSNGDIIASSCYEKCRYYPIDGGTSTCNKIVDRKDLVERYAKILDYIGWEGFADFDCIEDPRSGEILLMEINPRVPGTIKASFLSGINVAEIMYDHALGNPYKHYSYHTGFYMRNFGTEIIWFFAAKERFRSNPSWFKFFGKDVFYVDGSCKDPLPMLGGLLYGAVRLLNPQFRKSQRKK